MKSFHFPSSRGGGSEKNMENSIFFLTLLLLDRINVSSFIFILKTRHSIMNGLHNSSPFNGYNIRAWQLLLY